MPDKEEAAKILGPAHCEALQVPRENPEIWGAIGQTTKHKDLILQCTQGLPHKGLVPMLQALKAAKQRKD